MVPGQAWSSLYPEWFRSPDPLPEGGQPSMVNWPLASAMVVPQRLMSWQARWGSISCPGPGGWPTLSTQTSSWFGFPEPDELEAGATWPAASTAIGSDSARQSAPAPVAAQVFHRRLVAVSTPASLARAFGPGAVLQFSGDDPSDRLTRSSRPASHPSASRPHLDPTQEETPRSPLLPSVVTRLDGLVTSRSWLRPEGGPGPPGARGPPRAPAPRRGSGGAGTG